MDNSKRRKQGTAKIRQLEQYLNNMKGADKAARKYVQQMKHDIASASQGTRVYNPKTHKKYVSKTSNYIEKQAAKLDKAIERANSLLTTQRELNKASASAGSVYSHVEAKVFYKATQKMWQQKGVTEHERNVAILQAVNDEREAHNLPLLEFHEIVDRVLESNRNELLRQNLTPEERMTPEQREQYFESLQEDTSAEERYQIYLAQSVMNAVQEALDNLLTTPDFIEA